MSRFASAVTSTAPWKSALRRACCITPKRAKAQETGRPTSHRRLLKDLPVRPSWALSVVRHRALKARHDGEQDHHPSRSECDRDQIRQVRCHTGHLPREARAHALTSQVAPASFGLLQDRFRGRHDLVCSKQVQICLGSLPCLKRRRRAWMDDSSWLVQIFQMRAKQGSRGSPASSGPGRV